MNARTLIAKLQKLSPAEQDCEVMRYFDGGHEVVKIEKIQAIVIDEDGEDDLGISYGTYGKDFVLID